MSTERSKLLGVTFLSSGVFTLLCAPGVLLAERYDWPQGPFHLAQTLAVIVCFITSISYLGASRKAKAIGKPVSSLRTRLAWIAAMLTGVWLSFIVYVIVTFDLSGF